MAPTQDTATNEDRIIPFCIERGKEWCLYAFPDARVSMPTGADGDDGLDMAATRFRG